MMNKCSGGMSRRRVNTCPYTRTFSKLLLHVQQTPTGTIERLLKNNKNYSNVFSFRQGSFRHHDTGHVIIDPVPPSPPKRRQLFFPNFSPTVSEGIGILAASRGQDLRRGFRDDGSNTHGIRTYRGPCRAGRSR